MGIYIYIYIYSQGLPLKSLGSCSGAEITFLPNSSSGSMLDLYALVWSIVRISGGGARLLLHCLTELSQRLSVLLTILHLLPHSTLSLRRKVASLSLVYRYYFGRCSLELASCIPPPLERPRNM